MIRKHNIWVIFCLMGLVSLILVQESEGEISGIIECMSYGYKVEIRINGIHLKAIKGDGSESTRLFDLENPKKAGAPDKVHDRFVLKEGENKIQVKFTKEKQDEFHDLKLKLFISGRYTKPLFELKSKTKLKGEVEKVFKIEMKEPEDFTTITVTDADLK